jgi:ketose-bisphosphate aldolase
MLIPFKELLTEVLQAGFAVGYFEAWDVYSLEAVLEAAEEESSPVVLGIGGATVDQTWIDQGGLERLGAIGLQMACTARVPTSLLLNEVTTFSQIVRGIRAGFNAVMLDTSELPYEENLSLTRKVVEVAHPVGVGVEAELGRLPDASGELTDEQGLKTDPEQAFQFVSQTGIDALSVSVGNVHILTDGWADIDDELLGQIHRCVPIPLVIHGGTGFPQAAIPKAISSGVAKYNIGTALKKAFLEGVVEAVNDLTSPPNFQRVMGSRKQADILQCGKLHMRQEVIRRMRLWKP